MCAVLTSVSRFPALYSKKSITRFFFVFVFCQMWISAEHSDFPPCLWIEGSVCLLKLHLLCTLRVMFIECISVE